MALEYIAALAVALVVTGMLYFKRTFSYWNKKDVYSPPTVIPFGNAKTALRGRNSLLFAFSNYYKELKAKQLPYGGYYFFIKKFLVLADLNLLNTILIKDFLYFTDRPIYINEEVDPLTGHLAALRGAKWKALRAKLTPTFSSGKLKTMFQTLVDCTKELPTLLDEALARSEPIEIKDTFARYTTDVIGSCAFGIECNCIKNPDAEFRKWGKRIFEKDTLTVLKETLNELVPSLLRALKVSLTDKDVEKFFMNLVKETMEFRDKNQVKRNDFMQLLLDLKDIDLKVETKTGEQHDFYQNGLTFNELVAQAFVFFAGGFETSSTASTYLTYELARNPNIQEKVRREINAVLAKYNGILTYDNLNEMTYLDKCVQEALRKYPPALATGRICTKSYQVPETDLIIEKGTNVMVPIYGIHHDPEYYPDPEKFDPERFSEDNKRKRPTCAYLPFGDGPRNCIGLRFALLQLKVGMIALLRNHRFRLNPRTKTPLEYDLRSVILTVADGVWLDVERAKPL